MGAFVQLSGIGGGSGNGDDGLLWVPFDVTSALSLTDTNSLVGTATHNSTTKVNSQPYENASGTALDNLIKGAVYSFGLDHLPGLDLEAGESCPDCDGEGCLDDGDGVELGCGACNVTGRRPVAGSGGTVNAGELEGQTTLGFGTGA